jgi:hypothetical protein
MEEELQKRLVSNEIAFREINEAIARGQWPGEPDAAHGFRCECARLGCQDLIDLTPGDYERVRANPRWFVVSPGHELPDLETVVERRSGYFVVEKRELAGRLAEDTAPRS